MKSDEEMSPVLEKRSSSEISGNKWWAHDGNFANG